MFITFTHQVRHRRNRLLFLIVKRKWFLHRLQRLVRRVSRMSCWRSFQTISCDGYVFCDIVFMRGSVGVESVVFFFDVGGVV